MRLEKLSTIVNKLRIDFELDAIDIELLNTVKDCGGDAYVMKVIEKFDVVSPATTHKRIKHLLAKDYLDHEGTAGNLRTKLLIPSGRWAELDTYLRSLK